MQNEFAILYLEINIVAVVLISIILYKTNGLSKMVAQHNFAMSIIAEMVFFLSDALFVMVNEGVWHFNLGFLNDNFIRVLCKDIYFLSSTVMCYFWFIYFELIRNSVFFSEQKNIRRASTAMWILFALLVLNHFYKFLFYVDSEGVYHRGPYFWTMYIFCYIYVMFACTRALRAMHNKKYTVNKRILMMHVLFPLGPGIAGIIQYFYPRLPVACVTMSLTTLMFYLTWIDQLISLDPLTGLNNRKQLYHFYDHWVRNHSDGELLYVLMIDANKFKAINDNYGHIQGDQALKNIAEALRIACRTLPKRANISRYGGDEFAVLFESNDPSIANTLRRSVTDTLASVNERTQIPFELTVS
ncbi:MAG: GGDEF domain-containing protein, partial [Lachnospiraceae bacterium]|nr:GGDEF domain-containing protein [Lachnospiraceae bacterium]